MRMTHPVVMEYVSKLKSLLNFRYGNYRVVIDYSEEIGFDEVELLVTDEFGNQLGKLSKFYNDGKVFIKDRSISSEEQANDSEEVNTTFELFTGKTGLSATRFSIAFGLKDIIYESCLNLMEQLKECEPREVRSDVFEKLVNLLDEYILNILPTPPELLMVDYPESWGLANDEATEDALWSNTTPLISHDRSLSKVLLANRVLTEVCTQLKSHLLTSKHTYLEPSFYETSAGINNGLFYHISETQRVTLRKFFKTNKYSNIKQEDAESWVAFFSGLELPRQPLTWSGKKTHLFYMLLCATDMRIKRESECFVISPIQKQVQWQQLGKYIKLSNGESLSRKHGTNALSKYREKKTNPYDYIDVLFRNPI